MDSARPVPAGAVPSWITILTLFSITSIIETIGISQIIAFLPLDLQAMGLPQTAIPRWVGLLNAAIFILGLPLVPLWGVLADKYSRKLIIVRSAVVETVVFALVALSRHPGELAASLLLVGFQLGNTGVMLAAIRDVTPRARIGTAIAVFGATSPIGFAVGPALGGLLLDHVRTSIGMVYAVSSGLSAVSAAMLTFGLPEVRPAAVPRESLLALVYGALRGVFTDASARRLFTLFWLALVARMMSGPFLPLAVGHLTSGETGLASAIALVVGAAALVGGIVSPGVGALGDRVGFRPVLVASLLGAGGALTAVPSAPNVYALAAASAASSAFNAGVSAMVFALLAVQIPAERRSATLNLVYVPLYLAGIVGPAVGALVVTAGLPTVFYAAAFVVWMGAGLELIQPLTPVRE